MAWAKEAKVNYRSDRALVAFARRYHRILICHDKHERPVEHKVQVCLEIYEHGGQVIQVAGSSGQEALTSLAKILIYRKQWLDFFNGNDGIVTVSDATHIKTIPRKDLLHTIQGMLSHPSIPMLPPKITPKTPRRRKPKVIAPEQQPLTGLNGG